MSTKSAQPVKRVAAKATAAKPATGIAARVVQLEETVAAQARQIEQLSQIVLRWAEDQAVAQTLPQIEAQLRQQIKENLAQNGLAGAALPGTPGG